MHERSPEQPKDNIITVPTYLVLIVRRVPSNVPGRYLLYELYMQYKYNLDLDLLGRYLSKNSYLGGTDI